MKNLQNHPGSSLTLKNELKMLKKKLLKCFGSLQNLKNVLKIAEKSP